MKVKETQFKKINSSIKNYEYESLDDLLLEIKGYKYIVIWNPDGVVLEYAEKITTGHLQKFSELRAFSVDGELAVRHFGGEYRGRICIDGPGEDTDYLDESHLLWGDKNKNRQLSKGYTLLLEDRGTQLVIPCDVPAGEHAFIIIRNYVSKDAEPALYFDDWRMVDFFAKGYEKEGEKNGQK